MYKGVRIGEIDVQCFVSSRFKLDGGSMFGVIPKTLWEKKSKPDSLNRITLAVNTLLIHTSGMKILVEPGMGLRFSRKQFEIYDLDKFQVKDRLLDFNISPHDIDMVVFTHLHLDHAGGAVEISPEGDYVPVFPNAVHLVQELELQEAKNPHPLESASYRRDDFAALEAAGLLRILNGDEEIAPGVRVERTGGHTRGHQVVLIHSRGEQAIYPGDLIPTSSHLPLNWLMGWDLYPEETYWRKESILRKAAEENILIFWAHDPHVAASRVRSENGSSISLVTGSSLPVG